MDMVINVLVYLQALMDAFPAYARTLMAFSQLYNFSLGEILHLQPCIMITCYCFSVKLYTHHCIFSYTVSNSTEKLNNLEL